MITLEEITAVGMTGKPHGIKGELTLSFDSQPFDEDETPSFIFDMDGIFVPFFIENLRFKNDSAALCKFEGIDSENQARQLTGKTLYVHNQYLIEGYDDEDKTVRKYIGFLVEDKVSGDLGKIIDIEDSTQNVLFVVKHSGNELLIPATDYYITNIDELNRIIEMDLPEGLVDFDLAEDE